MTTKNDPHLLALAQVEADKATGRITAEQYERAKAELTQKVTKPKRSAATTVLVVIGALALVLVGLRIASAVYSKATEGSRWEESSKTSCEAALALRGGVWQDDAMKVSVVDPSAKLPTYRVDGGSLNGQPVYCLNFVSPVDQKITASHLFITAGGKPLG